MDGQQNDWQFFTGLYTKVIGNIVVINQGCRPDEERFAKNEKKKGTNYFTTDQARLIYNNFITFLLQKKPHFKVGRMLASTYFKNNSLHRNCAEYGALK